ncbi:hypothetical protein [Silvibacterium sp.]|uniref:hypothetical protein n=1 Tax=Silvibacterium sp. TaxID=1964179 RepID=UPI0039E66F66
MSQPISLHVEAQPQLCRHLKASGRRCVRRALPGDPYCYPHSRDQRRRGVLEIPLLEDRADLLQLYTGILRGIADGTLNLNAAKLLLAAARNVSQLLTPPRPAAAATRRRAAREESVTEPTPGPDAETDAEMTSEPHAPLSPALAFPASVDPALMYVDEFTIGPAGEDLAPPAPWMPPAKAPAEKKAAAREWSFDRFLRDSLFPDQAGRPLPESGYSKSPSKPQAKPETPSPNSSPDSNPDTGPDEDPDPTPSSAARLPESSAAEEPAAEPVTIPAPDPAAATIAGEPEPPHPGVVPNLWAVGQPTRRCRAFAASGTARFPCCHSVRFGRDDKGLWSGDDGVSEMSIGRKAQILQEPGTLRVAHSSLKLA